jgi:hypothetical protein
MNLAYFAQELAPLKWVEVSPGGEATVEEGPLDATALRHRLGGTPEQSRSPWHATVFVRTSGSGEPNWLATMLLRQVLTPGQQVRGPMFVLGEPNDEGEVTPASEYLVDAVLASIGEVKGP